MTQQDNVGNDIVTWQDDVVWCCRYHQWLDAIVTGDDWDGGVEKGT